MQADITNVRNIKWVKPMHTDIHHFDYSAGSGFFN